MELPVRPFFERQTPAKSLKGYLRKLMNNPRVSRYLEKHHEGIYMEFRAIAELEAGDGARES